MTDKITKCKKNLDDKITTHQKNHYSDLKKTIIIDDSGNNNLNIPRKKMNSNITKLNVLNRMIIENIPKDNFPNADNNSLFEDESSANGNEAELSPNSPNSPNSPSNMIIFDEKNIKEIEAIKFLPNYDEEEGKEEQGEKEDEKVLDTSIIDLDEPEDEE